MDALDILEPRPGAILVPLIGGPHHGKKMMVVGLPRLVRIPDDYLEPQSELKEPGMSGYSMESVIWDGRRKIYYAMDTMTEAEHKMLLWESLWASLLD